MRRVSTPSLDKLDSDSDEYYDAVSCEKHPQLDSGQLLEKYHALSDCEDHNSDTASPKRENLGWRHRQVIEDLEKEALSGSKTSQDLGAYNYSAEEKDNLPNEIEAKDNLDVTANSICSGYCSLLYQEEARIENENLHKSSSKKASRERRMNRILRHSLGYSLDIDIV